MNNSNAVEIFEKAPVPKAVLKNALPAMNCSPSSRQRNN